MEGTDLIFARAFAREAEKIIAIFEKFGLPTTTTFSAPVLANAALSDKKRQGGTITLVVADAVASCRLQNVPIEELESIIKAGL